MYQSRLESIVMAAAVVTLLLAYNGLVILATLAWAVGFRAAWVHRVESARILAHVYTGPERRKLRSRR